MATHQHGTELNPLSRTLHPVAETRWQPGMPDPAEEAKRLMEERREAQRMAKIRRFWYAEYERAEWWRAFNQGWSYVALIMMAVFAIGLIVGYVLNEVRHA